MWSSLPRSSPTCCAGVDTSSSCWDKVLLLRYVPSALTYLLARKMHPELPPLGLAAVSTYQALVYRYQAQVLTTYLAWLCFSLHPCEIGVARPLHR